MKHPLPDAGDNYYERHWVRAGECRLWSTAEVGSAIVSGHANPTTDFERVTLEEQAQLREQGVPVEQWWQIQNTRRKLQRA